MIWCKTQSGELFEAVLQSDRKKYRTEAAPLRLQEAKRPTFQAAKTAILDYLQKQGWTVKRDLKVPHATSPRGDLKFWFKTQAVYVSAGKGTTLGDASSTWADIRDMSPEEFVKKELEFAEKQKPKVNPNMWY